MKSFRVFDLEEHKMFYEGFALTNDGELILINHDGSYSSTIKDRYIIMFSTGKTTCQNQEIFAEDFIRYDTGYEFTVRYGIHEQFCPGDNMLETSIGFYAIDEEEHQYPLSDTEVYAECVFGNTYEGVDKKLKVDVL